MITAVNSKTKKEISFNTISQNDVENTLLWMFGQVDYYLTSDYKTKNKVVAPCNIWDDFNLHLSEELFLKSGKEAGYGELISDDYINSYIEFWKDKEPFKSFLL